MTALEKAFETVKEKQKELRKLKGTNSESTSQETSGIAKKRCGSKVITGSKRLFKGTPPLSFLSSRS